MDLKFKALFGVLLFCSVIFLLGCTTEPPIKICGDGTCSPGEDNTCPTDCLAPISGQVLVDVSGGYDATGDLWLEYYTSNNIYTNLSNTLSSIVGNNWSASSTRNLSIGFNQSQSVKVPVPRDGDRRIVLSNLKQGEYFFTVRSDDYAYFGQSEKLVIDEDKNYYVSLSLKPSNPVVRIIAYDESSNILTGTGNIKVYEVLEENQNGENNITENLVSSIDFADGEEINGLFYLWPQVQTMNSSSHFKAIVTKDNYASTQLDYISTYNKYNEYSAALIKPVPTTGNLKITIIPGAGTTTADLSQLVGKKLWVCNMNVDYGKDCSYSEPITSEFIVHLNDYKVGQYSVSAEDYNMNSPIVPVTVSSQSVVVDSQNGEASVKAYLGRTLKLSAWNNLTNKLIDANQILMKSLCSSVYASNIPSEAYIGCSAGDGKTWADIWGLNPISISNMVWNESDISLYSSDIDLLKFSALGVEQEFLFQFKQGMNDFALYVNPNDGNFTLMIPNSMMKVSDSNVANRILYLSLDNVTNSVNYPAYTAAFVLANPDLNLTSLTHVGSGTNLKTAFGNTFKEDVIVDSIWFDSNKNTPVVKLRGADNSLAKQKAAWAKATPIAIVDWNRVGNKLTLTVKDNSAAVLSLRGVYLGKTSLVDSNASVNKVIYQGGPTSSVIVYLNDILNGSVCTHGNSYSIDKNNIYLTYSSFGVATVYTQSGAEGLSGKC
ncbi:MAG: hypothetical protein NTY48_01565 [Candidatus Diapherotrites archaeon]|nr:hypothetical protein [Candidatus Diapherotrites archaeon]